MKRSRKNPHAGNAQRIGVAFYRPDQWEWLRQISEDRDTMHATYPEWLEEVESCIHRLKAHGALVERVDIDVIELLDWCQLRAKKINASARSAYVVELLSRQYPTQSTQQKGDKREA